MAQVRGSEQVQHEETPAVTLPDSEADAGFGAEFRELARQRRFVRETSAAPPATARPLLAPTWRDGAVAPGRSPRPTTPIPAGAAPRMSDDAAAMLAELARMSDRLVEAREGLVVERARADRAELDLGAMNERMMAARAMVHDAQRAAATGAERCAWLEGRCETLQEALDLAVHASPFTRWRWRRQAQRAGA